MNVRNLDCIGLETHTKQENLIKLGSAKTDPAHPFGLMIERGSRVIANAEQGSSYPIAA